MDMLTVSHIKKHFGAHEVITDLSFCVPEHTIYGFLGQNGAGKTTMMKMILGLLDMDHGEIMVNGIPVTFGQNKTNKMIGYLPDVPEFYSYMTPYEYLNLCGKITKMPASKRTARIHHLLALVNVPEQRRIQGFSRGMKQRLGIAQALLNEPKLLIADEPTSALDPLGRKEILDILQKVKKTTTVLFSTHILSDVERICDEIGVLHQGSLVLQGSMDELRQTHKRTGIELEFLHAEDAVLFEQHWAGGIWRSPTHLIYPEKTERDLDTLFQLLIQLHLHPLRVEQQEPTLESLFMEVIGQ